MQTRHIYDTNHVRTFIEEICCSFTCLLFSLNLQSGHLYYQSHSVEIDLYEQRNLKLFIFIIFSFIIKLLETDC